MPYASSEGGTPSAKNPGSGAERSLRLLRRAAMLGVSLSLACSWCGDNTAVRQQDMIDCNKSLNINEYMQLLSYKANFVSLHPIESDRHATYFVRCYAMGVAQRPTPDESHTPNPPAQTRARSTRSRCHHQALASQDQCRYLRRHLQPSWPSSCPWHWSRLSSHRVS
jgi:hypothetical protein